MLLSRRRQRRTGRPARTPRRALAGRLEARSAPAPSLFFPNKFLTQIGDWIRLSLACWHCLEKNLVSGRKCKRSKGELVELSWNVTFVAGQRVAPRSTTALDSPEEPLVLPPREPCWGTSSLRHESQAFPLFSFFFLKMFAFLPLSWVYCLYYLDCGFRTQILIPRALVLTFWMEFGPSASCFFPHGSNFLLEDY